MGSHSHSIRFQDDVWNAIKLAADHEGESAAEFIRISALARAAYSTARQGDAMGERFAALSDALLGSARDVLAMRPL